MSTNFTTTNTNSTTSNASTGFSPIVPMRRTLWAHIQIARIDHWFKNVFVLPGHHRRHRQRSAARRRAPLDADRRWACISICLVASSNYVINEVLDAPSDRSHPVKRKRPVPSRPRQRAARLRPVDRADAGRRRPRPARSRQPFAITVFVLWVMGCIYNIPPDPQQRRAVRRRAVRSGQQPAAHARRWFIGSTGTVAPASLLLSYWMVGCYFMAIKRYAEYREIGDPRRRRRIASRSRSIR